MSTDNLKRLHRDIPQVNQVMFLSRNDLISKFVIDVGNTFLIQNLTQ